MIRVGGWAQEGAVVVVGWCALGVLFVVGRHGGASLVVGRRGSQAGEGLRVVVGSQLRCRACEARAVLVTGVFVVGRLVTGVVPAVGGCGLGRVVVCRRPYSSIVSGGALVTGCVGWLAGCVVCDRVTICSGSGEVVV